MIARLWHGKTDSTKLEAYTDFTKKTAIPDYRKAPGSKGAEPDDVLFGGVYGFLTPNEMVAKDPGEWQTFDITLVGRAVTVVANGASIITNQLIPGITGGAIDSKEGEPGPIMIQGDHGPIEFRNITITPAK